MTSCLSIITRPFVNRMNLHYAVVYYMQSQWISAVDTALPSLSFAPVEQQKLWCKQTNPKLKICHARLFGSRAPPLAWTPRIIEGEAENRLASDFSFINKLLLERWVSILILVYFIGNVNTVHSTDTHPPSFSWTKKKHATLETYVNHPGREIKLLIVSKIIHFWWLTTNCFERITHYSIQSSRSRCSTSLGGVLW